VSDVRCLRRGVLGSDLSVVRPYDHRQVVADVHALATTTHLCVVAATVDEPAKGRYASEQIRLCDCGCSPGAPACTWLKKPTGSLWHASLVGCGWPGWRSSTAFLAFPRRRVADNHR
jgi:hypothetical protein